MSFVLTCFTGIFNICAVMHKAMQFNLKALQNIIVFNKVIMYAS